MTERIESEETLLLTAGEAAKKLRICEKTLWSHTHPRGDIPVVKIGRAVRYALEDLKAWIASTKTKA